MSDVRDRVDCSATGDTSMLFSTENGIHKEPQPPTESHNTTLHIEISRGSHASSLRPLSNKLQTEETCQFAKKTSLASVCATNSDWNPSLRRAS